MVLTCQSVEYRLCHCCDISAYSHNSKKLSDRGCFSRVDGLPRGIYPTVKRHTDYCKTAKLHPDSVLCHLPSLSDLLSLSCAHLARPEDKGEFESAINGAIFKSLPFQTFFYTQFMNIFSFNKAIGKKFCHLLYFSLTI